jgi:alpha-1,2-mannosyltransferase
MGCVSRKTAGVAALTVGMLAFLVRLVPVLRGGGLHGVLGYDDGVYFGAAEAFVFGRLPYRDFLLLHPPGIVLVLSPFAWLARVSGDDDVGLALARLAFMGVGAVNAVLVLRVAGRRLGAAAGLAGGVFYAVWQPAVYAERTTLLEPLVNLGVLSSLLLLGDPRAASRRRIAAAGAVLGLASAVKLWSVVPLVVLLLWVAWHRRGEALRFAAGAAGAVTVVCLPFLVAAPSAMFRLSVLDQLGRSDNAVGLPTRLAGITTAGFLASGGPHEVHVLTGALILLVVAAAFVAVWRVPAARPWCALLAAQAGLLVATPIYFAHYATYVAPALALLVAATVAQGTAALRRRPAWWTRSAVAGALLVALPLFGVSVLRAEGRPAPGPGLRAELASSGCVAADTPATLESADLFAHDLRLGCAFLVDPTGLTYDQDSGDLRSGSTVRARRADDEWQHQMLRYLSSGRVVILQHGNPDGLSTATLRKLGDGVTVTRHRRYDVYAFATGRHRINSR